MAVRWSNELRWYVGGYDLSTATTRSAVTLQVPALDKVVYSDPAESSIADIRRDQTEWAGFFEDSTRGLDVLIGTLIGTRGDMVSFIVGTATGSRAYCGTVGIMAVKAGGRVGELVRVEGQFTPDAALDPAKHFGAWRTTTAGTLTTSIDDSASSTGTHRLFVHVFRLSAGTFTLNVQDSAAGTIFIDVASATAVFSAIGSTAIQFTGTLRQYVRISTTFGGGASGSTDWFVAYRRSG